MPWRETKKIEVDIEEFKTVAAERNPETKKIESLPEQGGRKYIRLTFPITSDNHHHLDGVDCDVILNEDGSPGTVEISWQIDKDGEPNHEGRFREGTEKILPS